MPIAVLLIEDNPGDARLIREYLREGGARDWRLEWVSRLADGLAKLRAEHFDVAVVDLTLPDSRGLTTFTAVKTAAPGVPVLVTSSLDDEELAVAAVQEGAQDYLVKDQLAGHLLVRAIRYAIERQRTHAMQTMLVQVSAVLAAAEDQAAAAREVAALAVPLLGDCCLIDHRQSAGRLERVAAAGTSGAAQALAAALGQSAPALLGQGPIATVLRTGQSILLTAPATPFTAGLTGDPTLSADLIASPPASLIVVPLYSRNQQLGVLIGLTLGGGRRHGPAELALAEEVGRRCALALDNARLFAAEQRARQVAEQLAAERGELLAAQQALERHKDEFFANVSHDLRTPVTGIKASIEVVLANRPPDLPPTLNRMLTNIELSANRLADLVDNLLELTRLQAGRLQLQVADCDLRQLAEQAARTVEQLAAQRQQRLVLDLPPGPIRLTVDGSRLERALLNLLSNAAKYGRVGGLIQLGLAERPNGVVLTVADDGPGIPLAEQERIFDRFVRLESAAEQLPTGSGLGLAIARRLVELHGGHISLSSQPGAGATFSIWLPSVYPA